LAGLAGLARCPTGSGCAAGTAGAAQTGLAAGSGITPGTTLAAVPTGTTGTTHATGAALTALATLTALTAGAALAALAAATRSTVSAVSAVSAVGTVSARGVDLQGCGDPEPRAGSGANLRLHLRGHRRDHSGGQQRARGHPEASHVARCSGLRPASPPGVVNHSACFP